MKLSILIFTATCLIIAISGIVRLVFKREMVTAMGGMNAVIDEDTFTHQRKRMVEEQIAYRGVTDKKVLGLWRRCPVTCLFLKKIVRIVIMTSLCR